MYSPISDKRRRSLPSISSKQSNNGSNSSEKLDNNQFSSTNHRRRSKGEADFDVNTLKSSTTGTLSTMAAMKEEKALLSRKAETEKMMDIIADEDEEAFKKFKDKFGFTKLIQFANEQSSDFLRSFMDYGPPYEVLSEDEMVIYHAEIQEPGLPTLQLHYFLNKKVSPNLSNPEDMYNFPIHYVCRYANMLQLRMIVRAGSGLDHTNELGMTGLSICCMIKQPPDKKLNQVKIVDYLIRLGADVNIRDKAGLCAIDFATMNGDLIIVQKLLAAGARVGRENISLVAKRKNILDFASNPEIYKLLNEKQKVENAEVARKEEVKMQYRVFAEEERRLKKLYAAIDKKKMDEIKRKEVKEKEKLDNEIKRMRMARLQDDNKVLEKQLEEKKKSKYGEWRKDIYNRWAYVECKPTNNLNEIYVQGKRDMVMLRDKYNIKQYDKLWSTLTNGKNIEVEWNKDGTFDYCGENNEERPEEIDAHTMNGQHLDDLMNALAL